MLVPDTANNNTFDMDAAKFFHKRCQELGIPLVIVTRWAAYAAKVPVSCYNELASNGSWIGCRLRNAQRASIENLWARAASPSGSESRHGLPDRCDRAWFLNTFCAGVDAPGRGPSDTIWDLIAGFMQYDTVATLASIPILRDRFFTPCNVPGLHGVVHKVIGRTEQDHNIKSTEALSKFLNLGFKSGLEYNHMRKTEFVLMLQPRWANEAENYVALVVMRALFELGIFDCAGIVLHPVPGEGAATLANFAAETKKSLGTIGLGHVPVLVSDPAGGTSGTQHLNELYGKVTPAGITLVVTGSVDVAADFAENHPKAFVTKTQSVILVGGAEIVPEKDAKGAPTGNNVLEPDLTAQNFQLDKEAAQRFFRTAQKLLVPLVIITRHFVQAAQVPRTFYDILGDDRYGGTVGKHLHKAVKDGVTQLWTAAGASTGDSVSRRHLPDRCNRSWFIETFCSGNVPASDKEDDVWKCIGAFNVYNLQAILMALPPIYNHFVRGTSVTVRSVKHTIVGCSVEDPGIAARSELRAFICQCILMGTRLNVSKFDLQAPPAILLDESQSSSTWSFDERKEALNWLLPPPSGKDAHESFFGRIA